MLFILHCGCSLLLLLLIRSKSCDDLIYNKYYDRYKNQHQQIRTVWQLPKGKNISHIRLANGLYQMKRRCFFSVSNTSKIWKWMNARVNFKQSEIYEQPNDKQQLVFVLLIVHSMRYILVSHYIFMQTRFDCSWFLCDCVCANVQLILFIAAKCAYSSCVHYCNFISDRKCALNRKCQLMRKMNWCSDIGDCQLVSKMAIYFDIQFIFHFRTVQWHVSISLSSFHYHIANYSGQPNIAKKRCTLTLNFNDFFSLSLSISRVQFKFQNDIPDSLSIEPGWFYSLEQIKNMFPNFFFFFSHSHRINVRVSVCVQWWFAFVHFFSDAHKHTFHDLNLCRLLLQLKFLLLLFSIRYG